MIANEFFPPVESLVERRSDSGFLMLSSSLQMLHWDQRAWELCQRIAAAQDGRGKKGALPSCLHEFGTEIVRQLRIRTEPKDWEQFQLRRIIQTGVDSIFLSGIGLPHPRGIEASRVLLLLQEIRRRQEFSLGLARERFQLTVRETEVIEHLMKGWTNKEIANAIAISEQTVKEHIKHIMDKTRTSTRTGILAQILHG